MDTTQPGIDTITNEPLLITTTNNQEQTIIIINNDLTSSPAILATTATNTLVPIASAPSQSATTLKNEGTQINSNNTQSIQQQYTTARRKRAIDTVASYNGNDDGDEDDDDDDDSNESNDDRIKNNKLAKTTTIINGNTISIDNQVTIESTPTQIQNLNNIPSTTTTNISNHQFQQHHHHHDTANTDEIFQLLSQKIAKYCQVLSDLTNGEVFFKSSLNQRTLYWGTYKMMFNYSHQGLQYDRNDSLIKISGRSLSNDITNIVDELIGVDTNDDSISAPGANAVTSSTITTTTAAPTITATSSTTAASSLTTVTNTTSSYSKNDESTDTIDNIEFKECVIYADRLNDDIYDEYLHKFEKNRVFNDSYLNKIQSLSSTNDKNDTNIEDFEHDSNNDDLLTCEHCSNYSSRHLPDLKLHVLKEHERIELKDETPFECVKCKLNIDKCDNYINHLLLCYYPDLYTCKICNHNFDNYSDYYCHTKYIHTQVYACSLCRRRFKNVKELTEHDELMHSKSLNYCELCFEQMKSRSDLQEHYKTKHIKIATNQPPEHKLIRSILQQKQLQSVSRNDSIMSDKDEYLFDTTSQDETSIIVKNKDDDLSITTNSSINTGEEQSSLLNKSLNSSKVQKSDLIRGLLDRKHQCKWCTQRFFTKSQLKQHESTHVNAVLYCPVCDKEFTHKDRLAGHMKCHMEPSLECKICGKKFKRLCNLYNHELVHGLTEHAFMLCQFCGRGFRSRRDYQNHVIANHRDQLMKSEVIVKNGNNASSNATNEQKSNQSTPIINKPNKLNDLTNESIATQSSDEIDRSDNMDSEEKELKQDKHAEQHSYGLRSNKKSSNLSNTHLLVQAAEFVQNQTL